MQQSTQPESNWEHAKALAAIHEAGREIAASLDLDRTFAGHEGDGITGSYQSATAVSGRDYADRTWGLGDGDDGRKRRGLRLPAQTGQARCPARRGLSRTHGSSPPTGTSITVGNVADRFAAFATTPGCISSRSPFTGTGDDL